MPNQVVIDKNYICKPRCLTGKATDEIVDLLFTLYYTALIPKLLVRLALPERDGFEHSQNSTCPNITLLRQNRGLVKYDMGPLPKGDGN